MIDCLAEQKCLAFFISPGTYLDLVKKGLLSVKDAADQAGLSSEAFQKLLRNEGSEYWVAGVGIGGTACRSCLFSFTERG